VSIRANHPDIAEKPIELGTVTAGSVTDTGLIEIQHEKDVFGWIEGTVKWDDDQPMQNPAI
jgi:hypothetical protein